MTQRTVIVTGANSGIGKETAVALASQGDRVVIACRNPDRSAAALAEIRERSGGSVESVPLDLASFASVRAAAASITDRFDRVDVLVNNAGLVLSKRAVTEDGFEMTFGVNHLGPFLFTTLLHDLLAAAGNARVVTVASEAHFLAVGGLPWDDLQAVRFYNVWLTYGRSKLANILFTQELARRWASDGVVASSVHPGIVASNFAADGDTSTFMSTGLRLLKPMTRTPSQGADTSVWLATAEPGGDPTGSGTYWSSRRPGRLAPWARREVDGARLWTLSEELIATSS